MTMFAIFRCTASSTRLNCWFYVCGDCFLPEFDCVCRVLQHLAGKCSLTGESRSFLHTHMKEVTALREAMSKVKKRSAESRGKSGKISSADEESPSSKSGSTDTGRVRRRTYSDSLDPGDSFRAIAKVLKQQLEDKDMDSALETLSRLDGVTSNDVDDDLILLVRSLRKCPNGKGVLYRS